MSKIIQATYDSVDTVDNVVDDLIGTGIPRDNIFYDKSTRFVEISIADVTEPEVSEILKRHHPEKFK